MRGIIVTNILIIMIAIGKMTMGATSESQMVEVQNIETITYTSGATGIEGDIMISGKLVPVLFSAVPKMGAAEITEDGTLVQNGTVYAFKQIAECTAEGCTTY